MRAQACGAGGCDRRPGCATAAAGPAYVVWMACSLLAYSSLRSHSALSVGVVTRCCDAAGTAACTAGTTAPRQGLDYTPAGRRGSRLGLRYEGSPQAPPQVRRKRPIDPKRLHKKVLRDDLDSARFPLRQAAPLANAGNPQPKPLRAAFFWLAAMACCSADFREPVADRTGCGRAPGSADIRAPGCAGIRAPGSVVPGTITGTSITQTDESRLPLAGCLYL